MELIAAKQNGEARERLDEIYQGGRWCTGSNQVEPESVEWRGEYFRYFADVGVLARRLGRLGDASMCLRESARFAESARQGGAVLFEASLLVGAMEAGELQFLVTGDEGALYSVSDGEMEEDRARARNMDSLWSPECLDSCGNDVLSTISCGLQDQYFGEFKSELDELRRRGVSEEERARIFESIQPHWVKFLLLRSFDLFPTQSLAERLVREGAISQEAVRNRIIPQLHREVSVGVFDGQAEASLEVAAFILEDGLENVLELCEVLRVLPEEARERDCRSLFYRSYFQETVADGVFVGVYAGLAEALDGSSCQFDQGRAYILYRDNESGKVSVAMLMGTVGPEETCGSGGWGDHAILESEIIDAEKGEIRVYAGHGAVPSKGGCGLQGLVWGAHIGESVCKVDEKGELYCLTRRVYRQSLDEVRAPGFGFDSQGRLKADLREVDERVWKPLESVLNRKIEEVGSDDIRAIQERVLEGFGVGTGE